MKKIAFLTLVTALAVSCKKNEDAVTRIGNETTTTAEETASSQTPQSGTPVIAFDKDTHDFGSLKKGDKGEYEFTISNQGDGDLVIIDAKASCGCTVPEKPAEPIKPGESAKMKVVFSANTPGLQSKTVTITANTPEGQHYLNIKANVSE